MADESVIMEEATTAVQNPLVAITFQKNTDRKKKYLEAEPKALGITQIGLSAFQIICVSVFLAKDLSSMGTDIPFFISSSLVIIAGSVAIAAQNLHQPTLRACLGMQIVACCASIFNIILSMVKIDITPSYCWTWNRHVNFTLYYGKACSNIEKTQNHFFAESVIIQVTLMAIAVTLAAYCCKVVHCCAPAPKMPVITVQAEPAQPSSGKM
ncbi:uncharacterized protein LOC130522879 [Takifugu flavidus]|uniref:Membrane-spanning 4-domains subfamily A member 4A n=2 Tax=Takifugu TaxID=31032 RepID=A0A5C6N925_9TELE|nr:uncharacterized protein LOC130522879 [Takifugu flavidus]TNM93467.1 hypothetical protein fugu_001643 [Takifugu bimaculatus]TWW63663.1 hypothetical protein D4764_03G0006710 [Takifugu flavidus]